MAPGGAIHAFLENCMGIKFNSRYRIHRNSSGSIGQPKRQGVYAGSRSIRGRHAVAAAPEGNQRDAVGGRYATAAASKIPGWRAGSGWHALAAPAKGHRI